MSGPPSPPGVKAALTCSDSLLPSLLNLSCQPTDCAKCQCVLRGSINSVPFMLKRPPSRLLSTCFPGGSSGKESAWNTGDLGSIPGLGGSPGEGNDSPLQHSGLENSMDCIIHGVAKSLSHLLFSP